MGKFCIFFWIIMLATIFRQNCQAFEYENGDLIFQVAGNSNFSKAIEYSTGNPDSINYIHVGIIYTYDSSDIEVIEASPKEGVRIISLESFLASCPQINDKPGAVIKRLKKRPSDRVIINACSHIGEPYDWYYLPDNGMMYCSELVYESYLDESGEKIFSAQPMNFRSPDGTIPEFWINLYQKLGIDVPEGIPGTNPNDLSKHPQLFEVYRYF